MDAVLSVRDFLEVGGWALNAIAFATLLMWTLLFERLVYLRVDHPGFAEEIVRDWQARTDKESWYAQQIRRLMISRAELRADQSLALIRAIIGVCPLMGLLGTVTGMIDVYDVMAIEGSGNARAMASGISKAMVTTIAGLVAALSGLVTMPLIDRYARDASMDLLANLGLENAASVGADGEREPPRRGAFRALPGGSRHGAPAAHGRRSSEALQASPRVPSAAETAPSRSSQSEPR